MFVNTLAILDERASYSRASHSSHVGLLPYLQLSSWKCRFDAVSGMWNVVIQMWRQPTESGRLEQSPVCPTAEID